MSKSLMELDEWQYTLEWCLAHGEYNNRSRLQRQLMSIKRIKSEILEKQKKYYGDRVCSTCSRRVFGKPPTQDMRSFPFNPYKVD
jgi:hypothetical protein